MDDIKESVQCFIYCFILAMILLLVQYNSGIVSEQTLFLKSLAIYTMFCRHKKAMIPFVNS